MSSDTYYYWLRSIAISTVGFVALELLLHRPRPWEPAIVGGCLCLAIVLAKVVVKVQRKLS